MMLCEIFVKDSLKIDCWQRAFSLKKSCKLQLDAMGRNIRDKLCYAYTLEMRRVGMEMPLVAWKKGLLRCVFFQVCGI